MASRAQELAHAAVTGGAEARAAYFEDLRARVFGARSVHLGKHLGIEVVEVAEQRVTMRLAWREELRRGGGIFHGGAIMSLADHVAGCLFNADPRVVADGSTGLTTDFHASFVRAAEPGEAIVATGTVLRRGRNVTVMDIDVRSEKSGKTVAACRTTYLTVPRDRARGAGAGKP